MSHPPKTLAETLQSIRTELEPGRPRDGETLSSLSAALALVQTEAPAKPSALLDLVRLTVYGLRTLGSSAAADPERLRSALAAAVEAVERCLEASEAKTRRALLDAAGPPLLEALGWDPAGWTESGPAGEESADASLAAVSLDDAASLLMQLEPGDVKSVARVREALKRLAADESHVAPMRELVASAAKCVAGVETGSAEFDAAVAEAGRLLEAAMRATPDELARKGEALADAAPPMVTVVPSGADAARSAREPAPSASEASSAVESLPPDTDRDLLRDFIAESRDYIEGAEAALLALETDPNNAEAINTVFRAFHTIKGTSAFLGLSRISELAHHAESLLDRIRNREIRCSGGYADLALLSVDVLKALLDSVQTAMDGGALTTPEGYHDLLRVLANPEAAGVSGDHSEIPLPSLRVGDILVAEGLADRETVELVAETRGDKPIGLALIDSSMASVTDVAVALRTQKKITRADASGESSVRIRTDRLDRLIDLVGELVIAQSMLSQDEIVRAGGHHDLSRKVGHAGKIVRELHDLSMSMRMVPLKGTFQKLARLVRDVAQKTGKQVELVVEGEDTEIDRNMVDVIADPLVHMVRNAVDHGIELPDVREAAGKPRAGVVRISAFHAGGNVVVELQDDGKGLNRQRILEKALEKGLIESDKALADREVFNLIFAPGFSTAEKVTDVSGRGVGMDVVRRNIEALRGRIDISSEFGKGSTFSMRLPLTLAITDGMLVRVGTERYIVPTVHIHMSFRPERGMLSSVAGRGEMVLLRGELLPIVRAHRLFDVNGAVEDPTTALLMIIGDSERRSALLVDELLGQQQVVVKSLGAGVGKVPGVSGGAILGDGRVGLILDVAELIALSRQEPAGRGEAVADEQSAA